MANVKPEAVERVRITADDLLYLRTDWDQDVSDGSLRRSSPILRRLLVDGLLLQAWRDLGLPKQPLVSAPSLEARMRGLALAKVRFAQAGGGTYRGMKVDTVIEYGAYLTPEQASRTFSDAPERDYSLRRFLEGTCIVVNGTSVSRETLVKYVANKLGGVHLDRKRDSKRDEEMRYSSLDMVRGERVTADKPAIYFEYLSIGQALLNSPDVERFLVIAENVKL